MTSSEADNLIATLPKPGGLQLYRKDDQIVMDGGKWGSHALSTKVSSAERLLAHWKGYVENQGLSLGPGYSQLLPTGASQEREYQPGDKVTFWSASYSAAGGWRPGTVVRATPKRVLVAFHYKYEYDQARTVNSGGQAERDVAQA